jgi:class 3 adenylate cyclase
MDEIYELLIHEVHRYEGTVNELTGDGLVAFFGAPLAVELAPQRAGAPAWPCTRRWRPSVPGWSANVVCASSCGWGLTPGR